MLNLSPGYFLIFHPSGGVSTEMAAALSEKGIEYDLVMHYDVLVSCVRARCPDAIIVINNYPSPSRVVREIRTQRLFDAIPLVVSPSFSNVISLIQNSPSVSPRAC